MFNKKLALMVLSAAALGLASCGGGNNEQSSSASSGTTSAGSQGSTVTVPTEEGKISIYFTWVDFTYVDDAGETQESIKLADLPEYCAPFITGAWYDGDWADFKLEMTRIPDTAVFYAMIDADSDLGDLGYQITLGYSAASGVSAAKQGINWSYKTAYSEDYFPGYDHPIMTKIADNLYECASDKEDAPMGFKSILPKPVEVKNLSVKFMMEADEELNMADKENLEYVVKGSFDNWEVHPVGEADEEGYYTLEMGDIIAGTFEFCFGVHNKLLGGMDDAYNFMHVDMEGVKVSGKGATYTEVYDEDDEDVLVEVGVTNYQINVLGTTKADTVLNLGKFANPKKMMKDGEVVAYELPSDEAPVLPHSLSIALVNVGTHLAEGVVPYFVGAYTSWQHVEMEELELTGDDAALQAFIYTIPADTIYEGIAQEFKFTDGQWNSFEVAPADEEGIVGGNFSIVPERGVAGYQVIADLTNYGQAFQAAGAMDEGEIELPESSMVTFRVYNTSEEAFTAACVAGNMQGWDPASSALAKDAEEDYYQVAFDFGGWSIGDKVEFKITNGTWDVNIGVDGDNYVFYLSYGVEVYEFDADISAFTGNIVAHQELLVG